MTRQLRIKPKTAQKKKPPVEQKSRTVDELLTELQTYSTPPRKLTDGEVALLIDAGAAENAKMNKLKKRVTGIKLILKAAAILGKWKTRASPRGVCSIKKSTESVYGTATELAKLLKKLKKPKLFDTLVSVKIGEVKKYLGEEVLIEEGYLTLEDNPYGSMTLKVTK